MKDIVNNLDAHPTIAFILSLLGIGTGVGVNAIHPLMQVNPHEYLDVAVKLFQIAAYSGGALAGFVSFHGWFSKRKNKNP